MKKKNPRAVSALDEAIGERIKARREYVGMSQTELAEAEGVKLTFQQIQKYEKGINRIAATRLVAIANALQTTPTALLGLDKGSETDAVAKLTALPGAVDFLRVFSGLTEKQRRSTIKFVTSMSA